MVEVDRVSNPHDLFFKVTLSSQQAIEDFFKAHLPEELRRYIPIDSIKRVQGDHISSKLRELRNDLIFTAQIEGHTGFIFLEHQSSADWRMPIRFLKYNTLLIEHYLKDNGPKVPLPFILNLCLYHGKINKPYPYPNNLYDYFPNTHVAQKLGLSAQFHLIDITASQGSVLESHGTVSLLEKLFKYRKEKVCYEVLEKELDRCREWILGTQESVALLGEDYWEAIFYYASNILDPAYVSEEKLVNLFIEKLFLTKEKIMRTIARQIEERVAKRVEEKVEKREKSAIAKNMLEKGCEISFIEEITGLSPEAIEKLKQE
jgi:predicted transposase/invertase (TIGR01784 family)